MSLITGSLKDVLSIKMKFRHDDITDQFSRIFMVKMFVISSFIMSVDFFSDKVSCIVSSKMHMSHEFVHSACWIQGFYIYEELIDRMSESGYYGLPKDVELDGIYPNGKMCRRINKATNLLENGCGPMTKIFFVQYQYFPFFIASLAILYYMPYILFRVINPDIISLKSCLKHNHPDQVDALKIAESYFNRSMNGGTTKLKLTTLLNIGVKVLYVIVNITSFDFTNRLLNYNYRSYGVKWLNWSALNNTQAYDYSTARILPKPGNLLLPPMGFCEITEGLKEVRFSFLNTNKFICEISPNVLYQYVLIVLWFLFVISICVSIIGLLIKLVSHVCLFVLCTMDKDNFGGVTRQLTIRELEYLHFIKTINLPMYGDILRVLRKENMSVNRLNVDHIDNMKPTHNSLLMTNGIRTSLLLQKDETMT